MNVYPYFKNSFYFFKILNKFIFVKNYYFYKVYLNTRKRNFGICTICYGNQIKILIKPCNHLVTCTECASKIECCPICRASILSTEIVEYI